MNRRLLLAYQLVNGLLDTVTGLLLLFSPGATLHMMSLHASPENFPFLSYIGAFVLSLGSAYLYGAFLTTQPAFLQKLQVVWLLSGVTRAFVALFLVASISGGAFGAGWINVAVADGVLALIQGIGLVKG
jgi:hypothetical protein